MNSRALRVCALLAAVAITSSSSAQSAPATPAVTPPSTVASRPSSAIAVRAEGDGLTALLTAPADVIEVGSELPFTLTLTADAATTISQPDLGSSRGPFDVREVERDSRRDGEARIFTVQFVATTYAAGQVEFPALEVDFKGRDGNAHTLSIGPIPLEVVSLVGGEFDPSVYRDIKGAIDIDDGGWMTRVFAGVGVCVLAALLIALDRRRKATAAIPMSAAAWAHQELELLERDGLIERGEVHRFWVRLSGTVREYVERQFSIAAPDQTTNEFLAHASAHHAIDASHRQMLERFLRAADGVKFAAHEPRQDECLTGLASAHAFVRETTPSQSDETAPVGATP